MVKKKEKKKEKITIGFNSDLSDDTETIKLVVTYNKELMKLLRKVAVSGEKAFSFYLGQDEDGNDKKVTLERTRVKTAVWSGFNSDGRDLLFIKELVMNGRCEFNFYNISLLEDTVAKFTNNVNRAIELINEYSNIKHKVEFSIEELDA